MRWLGLLLLALLIGGGVWWTLAPSPRSSEVTADGPSRVVAPKSTQAPEAGSSTSGDVSADPDSKELEQLMACYQDPACQPEGDDPRAGEHQAAQRVADALRQSDEPVATVRQRALEALELPNGHIQRAALEVLMRQPPDAEATAAVAEALASGHDPVLFDAASDWLADAVTAGHAKPVEDMLIETLLSGSPYLGQRMADHLLKYLTVDNQHLFAALLPQLPPQSHRALRVRQALQEFELRQQGG